MREYGISVVQAFGQVPLQSRLEIPIERGGEFYTKVLLQSQGYYYLCRLLDGGLRRHVVVPRQ